jgi:hypothetical protein
MEARSLPTASRRYRWRSAAGSTSSSHPMPSKSPRTLGTSRSRSSSYGLVGRPDSRGPSSCRPDRLIRHVRRMSGCATTGAGCSCWLSAGTRSATSALRLALRTASALRRSSWRWPSVQSGRMGRSSPTASAAAGSSARRRAIGPWWRATRKSSRPVSRDPRRLGPLRSMPRVSHPPTGTRLVRHGREAGVRVAPAAMKTLACSRGFGAMKGANGMRRPPPFAGEGPRLRNDEASA